jgi:hypothetical protein
MDIKRKYADGNVKNIYENRVIPFEHSHNASMDRKINEMINKNKDVFKDGCFFCFAMTAPISNRDNILVIDVDIDPNEYRYNMDLDNCGIAIP